jgi:hypothetical protein
LAIVIYGPACEPQKSGGQLLGTTFPLKGGRPLRTVHYCPTQTHSATGRPVWPGAPLAAFFFLIFVREEAASRRSKASQAESGILQKKVSRASGERRAKQPVLLRTGRSDFQPLSASHHTVSCFVKQAAMA